MAAQLGRLRFLLLTLLSWALLSGASCDDYSLGVEGSSGGGGGDAEIIDVVALAPGQNALDVAANANIEIEFFSSIDIDEDVFDENLVRVYGSESGPADLELSLIENDEVLRMVTTDNFFAGEEVSVNLGEGAYDNGDDEQTAAFVWRFRVASTPSSMDFSNPQRFSVTVNSDSNAVAPANALIADLNNDGWGDVVVATAQAKDVRVFLNDMTGDFGEASQSAIEGDGLPGALAAGDFNRDGEIDVVVGTRVGDSLTILRGDGSGALAVQQQLSLGEGVQDICPFDMDGDGDEDLAVTLLDDDNVTLLRNNGSTFTIANSIEVGDGEFSCVAADMDGDGFEDLVVGLIDEANAEDSSVRVLLSEGDGSFAMQTAVAVSADPWQLAAGDLDGDGDVDLAMAFASSGELGLLFGNGLGGLGAPAVLSAGDGEVKAVALADLDADGDLDAVLTDFTEEEIVLVSNNGGGQMTVEDRLSSPGQSTVALPHDRDGDGDLDITVVNQEDDELLFYTQD